LITIQSGMLIALGFLAAVLLGLLVAPALWRRAVRLTTRRIKTTIPLSDMEIEADRDRIRAEYAIKMHKLEMLVDQVKLTGARQQIEINRRDARVNMLEADLEQLKASYEEAQNAKRVLEQTIEARLPKLEARLADAKKVLQARESEVSELNSTAQKQVRALASARSLNDEHRKELARLGDLLSEKVPTGEAGLRAELQSFKTKTKEQAQLIERLQSLSSRRGQAAALASSEAADDAVARQAQLNLELTALRAENEDQGAQIARLQAAVEVFEKNADTEMLGSVRESRIALKARVQALEAQILQQTDTVSKLRSELAAANESLARQASHFTDELKRLGSGAASGQGGRRAAASTPRTSLAERIARANSAFEEDASKANVSAEPITEGTAAPSSDVEPQVVAVASVHSSDPESAATEIKSDPASSNEPPLAAEGPRGRETARSRFGKRFSTPNRPRLLDRLSGLSRTS